MAGGGSHGVVAVGDSWLTGYGLPLGGLSCVSWAAWLAWAGGACLTQHAVNGATAQQVVRDQLPLLSHRRYQLGVAWLGANDIGRLDVDALTAALTQVCLGLRSSCQVVAVGTLPATMRTPDLSWRACEHAVGLANGLVRRVVEHAGVTLIELEGALNGPWSMAPDRQHPTSVGQLEAAHVAAASLGSLALLRQLPDAGSLVVPTHQQRLYNVPARERIRGALVDRRKRRNDRALLAGAGS
jgi:hypothetical protein